MASGGQVNNHNAMLDLLGRTVARLDLTLLKAAATEPDLTTPTPCADWDLGDLLGHLEAIAGSYVLWVSASAGGRRQQLRDGDALSVWNATMVARVPRRFLSMARPRWAELAADHLALARAFPNAGGLVLQGGRELTVAEHAGVAALEWWVHEWDVRTALSLPHETDENLEAELLVVQESVVAPSHGEAPVASSARDRLLLGYGRTP